jgi:hypothetical protein
MSDCQNEPLLVPTNTPTPPTIIPSVDSSGSTPTRGSPPAGAPSEAPMVMPANPHDATSEFPMVMPSRHPWAPPCGASRGAIPCAYRDALRKPHDHAVESAWLPLKVFHGHASPSPMPPPPAVPLVAPFPSPTVAPSLSPTVSNATPRTKPIEALPARVPLFRGGPFWQTAVIPSATPIEAPSYFPKPCPSGRQCPTQIMCQPWPRFRTA